MPAQELAEAAQYFAERLGETGDFSRMAGVSGVVRCDAPLTAELSGQPCVYYSMKVARYEAICSEI